MSSDVPTESTAFTLYNARVVARNSDGTYWVLGDEVTLHRVVPRPAQEDQARLRHSESGDVVQLQSAIDALEAKIRAKDMRDGLVDGGELIGEAEAAMHPQERLDDSGAEEADAEEERQLAKLDDQEMDEDDNSFIDNEHEPSSTEQAVTRAIAATLARKPRWVPAAPLLTYNPDDPVDGRETPPVAVAEEEDEEEEAEEGEAGEAVEPDGTQSRVKRERDDGAGDALVPDAKRACTEKEEDDDDLNAANAADELSEGEADAKPPVPDPTLATEVRGTATCRLLTSVADETPGRILRFGAVGLHFLKLTLTPSQDACTEAHPSIMIIPPHCSRMAPDDIVDVAPAHFHRLQTALVSEELPQDFYDGMRTAWVDLLEAQKDDMDTLNTVALNAAADGNAEDGDTDKSKKAVRSFFKKAADCLVRSVASSVGHLLGHRALLFAECLERLAVAPQETSGTLSTAQEFCAKLIRDALHCLGLNCGAENMTDPHRVQAALVELVAVGRDMFDHPYSPIQGFDGYVRSYPDGKMPTASELGKARVKYAKDLEEGQAAAAAPSSATFSWGADWVHGLLINNRRKMLALEVLRAKPGAPLHHGKLATTLSSSGVQAAGKLIADDMDEDGLDGAMEAIRNTINNVRKVLAALQLRKINGQGFTGGATDAADERMASVRAKWESEMRTFAVQLFRCQRMRALAVRRLTAKTVYWQFAGVLTGSMAKDSAMDQLCKPCLWGPSAGILRGLARLAPAALRPDALPAALSWANPTGDPIAAGSIPPRPVAGFGVGLWYAVVIAGAEDPAGCVTICRDGIGAVKRSATMIFQRVRDMRRFLWVCRQFDGAMAVTESRAGMDSAVLAQLIGLDAIVAPAFELKATAPDGKPKVQDMALPQAVAFTSVIPPVAVRLEDPSQLKTEFARLLPAPGGNRWMCSEAKVQEWTEIARSVLYGPSTTVISAVHVDCSKREYARTMVIEAAKLGRNGNRVMMTVPLALRAEAGLEVKAQVNQGFVRACIWEASLILRTHTQGCSLAVVGLPHANAKELSDLATVLKAGIYRKVVLFGDARLGMLPVPGPRSSPARLFQMALEKNKADETDATATTTTTTPLDAMLEMLQRTARRAVMTDDDDEDVLPAGVEDGAPPSSVTDELDRHVVGLKKALARPPYTDPLLARLATGLLRSAVIGLREVATCKPERKDSASVSDGRVNLEVHWNMERPILTQSPAGWKVVDQQALKSNRTVYHVHGSVLHLLQVGGPGLPTTLRHVTDVAAAVALGFGGIEWNKFARIVIRLDLDGRGAGAPPPPDCLLKFLAQLPVSAKSSDDFVIVVPKGSVDVANFLDLDQLLAQYVRYWTPRRLLNWLASLDEAPMLIAAAAAAAKTTSCN